MSSATSPAVQLLVTPGAPAVPAAHTTIRVRDLEVLADIGINADELGRRQPLIIHAELRLSAIGEDRIDATFDYREIVGRAEALAAERIALIETFARRLAEACLDDAAVLSVDISIDKPEALPNGLAGVRVSLARA